MNKREPSEPFGPVYNITSEALTKFRRGPNCPEYAEAIEAAVKAAQRSALARELPAIKPRCASGTWHSTGEEIGKAVRQQQRAALLAYPGKVRRNRTEKEWLALYIAAMNEKARQAAACNPAQVIAASCARKADCAMTATDDQALDALAPELKLSLRRERVERLLAMLEAKHTSGSLTGDETKARKVLELRLFGAGASPKKFMRLEAQQIDGVLRSQYRFAGAAQTGRTSSQGAQIQNLTRDVVGEDGVAEAVLVDAIADGCSHSWLAAAAPAGMPVARKLALLVRPALVAAPGKVFVWSDWSAIEARITPWLANSPGGESVLDLYRANDRDPSLPDVYTIAAADILHKDTGAITKLERQTGKVATLSLQFLGSTGALMNMALAYRVHLDEDEARRIVDAWRAANPWVREFGDALWDAAMAAWNMPGSITAAGRLAFVYDAGYLGGALFMALPSGRLLTYPRLKWRERNIIDKATGEKTGMTRTELSFRRARGRAKLWAGTLAENATQACAADCLRETVARVETNPELTWMLIRMTTHDEVVCECDEARAGEAKAILRREMLALPDWAGGLPMQSEESVWHWYTKSKAAVQGKR